MTRLRPLPASNVIRNLKTLGFKPVRQKGSHIFFRHDDGRTTVVPFHKGEDISTGLLHSILKNIETNTETFFNL